MVRAGRLKRGPVHFQSLKGIIQSRQRSVFSCDRIKEIPGLLDKDLIEFFEGIFCPCPPRIPQMEEPEALGMHLEARTPICSVQRNRRLIGCLKMIKGKTGERAVRQNRRPAATVTSPVS